MLPHSFVVCPVDLFVMTVVIGIHKENIKLHVCNILGAVQLLDMCIFMLNKSVVILKTCVQAERNHL